MSHRVTKPSSPRSPAPTSPKQKAERTNHLIKKLGSGSFADVYLSLPKITADAILEAYTSSSSGPRTRRRKADTLARLRDNLQATKIGVGLGVDSIDTEVRILQHLRCLCPQPFITETRDADDSPLNKVWYTMSLYPSGSLDDLLNLTSEPKTLALPVSLAWHICTHLGKALLYLHHGWHDGVREPEWPVLTHEDIFGKNILFRLSKSDSDGSYPNAILADFGKGWFVQRDTASIEYIDTALQRQYRDLQALACTLMPLAHRLPDNSGLDQTLLLLENADRPHRGAKRNQSAYIALRKFVKMAEKRCLETYEPLGPELVAHFGKQVVSDGELEEAFPVLVGGAESAGSSPSSTSRKRKSPPAEEGDDARMAQRAKRRQGCCGCVML